MIVLSIDPGIINLGICLLETSGDDNKSFNILLWEVVNISGLEEPVVKEKVIKEKCSNEKCKCNAKFIANNLLYCKKHNMLPLLPIGIKPSLSKTEMLKILGIVDTKQTKQQILNTYSTPIPKPIVKKDKLNGSNVPIINISYEIKNKLNALFSHVTHIDHVVFENQIGKYAARLKTVQGMLAQYFVMNNHMHIGKMCIVSAINKLKHLDLGTTEYDDRKSASVTNCSESLPPQWLTFLNTHDKQDDLCDAYLQGMWFIKKMK